MRPLKRNLWWPPRISFGIPMTISSLIFSGTGCNSLHTIKFIPENDMLFVSWNVVETPKFLPAYGGGLTFYYTSQVMYRFIPLVHRARPLSGFKNGPNLRENSIEYVLLTSWDGNVIVFLAQFAKVDVKCVYGMESSHITPGHDLAGIALDPTSFLCPSRRWGRGEPGEPAT